MAWGYWWCTALVVLFDINEGYYRSNIIFLVSVKEPDCNR